MYDDLYRFQQPLAIRVDADNFIYRIRQHIKKIALFPC